MASNDCQQVDMKAAMPPPPSYNAAINYDTPEYIDSQPNPEMVPLNANSQEKEYEAHLQQQGTSGYEPSDVNYYPPPRPSQLDYNQTSHNHPMLPDKGCPQNAPAEGQVMYSAPTQVVQIAQIREEYFEPYSAYMCWSICNCLCCCWLLGIVAIVYSYMTQAANYSGDRAKAKRLSKITLILNIVTPIVGIICGVAAYAMKSAYYNDYYDSLTTTSRYYDGLTTTSRYYNRSYDVTTRTYYFG